MKKKELCENINSSLDSLGIIEIEIDNSESLVFFAGCHCSASDSRPW